MKYELKSYRYSNTHPIIKYNWCTLDDNVHTSPYQDTERIFYDTHQRENWSVNYVFDEFLIMNFVYDKIFFFIKNGTCFHNIMHYHYLILHSFCLCQIHVFVCTCDDISCCFCLLLVNKREIQFFFCHKRLNKYTNLLIIIK